MTLFLIARFHAPPEHRNELAAAIHEVSQATIKEIGCLKLDTFVSTRDQGLFFIHSAWKDEEAFETHSRLEHTVVFLGEIERLVDQPFEITRLAKL